MRQARKWALTCGRYSSYVWAQDGQPMMCAIVSPLQDWQHLQVGLRLVLNLWAWASVYHRLLKLLHAWAVVLAILVRGFFWWLTLINHIWACRKSHLPSLLLVSLECVVILSSIICWSHEYEYWRLTSLLIYGFHISTRGRYCEKNSLTLCSPEHFTLVFLRIWLE